METTEIVNLELHIKNIEDATDKLAKLLDLLETARTLTRELTAELDKMDIDLVDSEI